MNDELLAYSIAKMKEFGLVDGESAKKGGIGCMTDARVKAKYALCRASFPSPSCCFPRSAPWRSGRR